MKQFDRLVATFAPKVIHDLPAGTRKWIGRTATWEALWEIEAVDSAQYAGQWAMALYLDAERREAPFCWVPSGDLTPSPVNIKEAT